MRALLLFFFLVFCCVKAPFAWGVDRSNFKTCDQSAFCKRHRHLEPGQSQYVVVGDSVKFEGTHLEAVLRNEAHPDQQLSFVLRGIRDSQLRLIVDELNPKRPRFVPEEVLDGRPKLEKFKSHSPGAASSLLMTADGNKIVLHYRPFRLDAYSGTQNLVLSINSQGLFKFEHFREKESGSPSDTAAQNQDSDAEEDVGEKAEADEEAAEQQHKEAEQKEEEGFWEEHFKTHHDSKPFGSSSVGLDVSFIGFQHIYGLPEHADAFALKSTHGTDPYRLYNLDVFEYELHNPMALYGSIPYVFGHSVSKSVAVLWLNAAETWVDVRSSTADKGMLRSLVDRFKSSSEVPQMDVHFMSESGLVDLFLLLGPGPRDVFRQFSSLTGVTQLPPLFSIAYHQCRWNYNDMEDVKSVDEGFDTHDIPYDVLWLDIEHTDGKKYFTWDPHRFPDPKTMIEGLASKQRKMVTIIDPHIKRDDGYKVYKEAKDAGYFIKDKDGNDFEGWCWPGSSMYLDFMNPQVREFWANKFKFEEYEGSSNDLFVWNDMNEPSVFNGPEVTMHKDSKHHGGWEHRDIHNIYGFLHHSSTYKGLLDRSGGRLRPFVLTRSFFVGSQRFGAVWTGDNMAEWSHLQIAVPMLLSLSVAGIPFVGADVGGFFRNPDEELLVRWYQAGAFYPFYRAHAHLDTRRREPWLFSEEGKNNIRNAIRYRYRLLPYWYTKFYEHSVSGLPVMRPCWLEFPEDENGFDEDRQFFVGEAVLVRPVMEPGAKSVSLYLPGEDTVWYNFATLKGSRGPGAVYVDTPMDAIPVFVRGGTVVPTRERVRRSSSLMSHDPITLYVALNYHGDHANGTLYLDDGESYAYLRGEYLYRRFQFSNDGGPVSSLTSENLNTTGKLKSDVWLERVVMLGVRFYPTAVHLFHQDYNPLGLKFTFDRTVGSMVIRKPGVPIQDDWRIDIHGQ